MVKKLKAFFKRAHINRTTLLAVVFVLMSLFLLRRIYNLQIINGAYYAENFSMKTTRTLTLKSTRGNIYDRNGRILATNELSYSLTITDAGSYSTSREKALALNGEAYRLKTILEANGDRLDNDFHVTLDGAGDYIYNVSGQSLLRFKADVYGHAKIDDLKAEERNATAAEMMAYLISEQRFAIIRDKKPYTAEELASVGLPETLTPREILDIVYVRYELFTTSYQKYVPVTIATGLSAESVAELQEQQSTLTGIDIAEDSIRVYPDAEAFASIIGYTGKISADELTVLKEENSAYNSTSIVGKSGIEKVFETDLQGTNGKQTVYVDNLGKVTEVDEDSLVEPRAGRDVTLTIDKDLQLAAYKILEQRIAGVLVSVIINEKTFDYENLKDSSDIRIPIYDVYNAMIENSVIDTSHFIYSEASPNEKLLLEAHDTKQSEVFAAINRELTGESPVIYSELTQEMQEYESYIVDTMLASETGILNTGAIDKNDETYLAWAREGSISLREYLTYAASQNWIDITSIAPSDTYLSSDAIYEVIADYIINYLSEDKTFDKLLYKYMLQEDRITPNMIINVLYDQGILDKEDELYDDYQREAISSYDLMVSKITNLEITPAMLALSPCSGSAVIVNPMNGEILACVTYPGYDNNRLANTMDVAYYNKLAADESRPFYNRATQQTTAPGSTFKIVTATAGLEEGVVDLGSYFYCNGVFDLIETPLSCWQKEGHGDMNVVWGIQNSCNVYFANVAYLLGQTEMGTWSDSLSLGKLQQYAKLFDLDKASGIEIPEASPQVSTQYAIQTCIGQGTNAYTTTQLARYAAILANEGTSYNISLVDKVTDTDGNLVRDFVPTIESELDVASTTWDIIRNSLKAVINTKAEWNGYPIQVAGKTGTAQSSRTTPSHGLFVCYAPYEAPQVAMAVRIGNGYSSINAMLTAQDIISYYFNLVDEETIIPGHAVTTNISQVQND